MEEYSAYEDSDLCVHIGHLNEYRYDPTHKEYRYICIRCGKASWAPQPAAMGFLGRV